MYSENILILGRLLYVVNAYLDSEVGKIALNSNIKTSVRRLKEIFYEIYNMHTYP